MAEASLLPRHQRLELSYLSSDRMDLEGGNGPTARSREKWKCFGNNLCDRVEFDLCGLIPEICMLCLRSGASSFPSLGTVRRQESSPHTSPVVTHSPSSSRRAPSPVRAPGLGLREAGTSRGRTRDKDTVQWGMKKPALFPLLPNLWVEGPPLNEGPFPEASGLVFYLAQRKKI